MVVEEMWQRVSVIKFRYQLLYIGVDCQTVAPCVCNRMEKSVWMIEFSILKTQLPLGLLAHQIKQDKSRSRIVTSIEKRWRSILLPELIEPLF
ncbi:hypothetical protein BpHYR1_010091 [Brachionus plicatilis]|uniref:Uncharacterized protein n=1 Tax=Brachionus plicatilis TaxID=10195 RepID=A0A3M7QS84_BRAPC|nr:hypothetical protein BpHYR1_010091 [Brachionus plicatilis]